MDIRVVFMGSPEFALPTLRALIEHYDVAGVVTQPDKPAGRGRNLTPPPIKELARAHSLPVIQPRRLRDPDAMQQLQNWNPNLIVVAAFGQILRPEVLNLPRFGCLNVHASLLPRWRGAAPIQAALLNGDEQTGVTLMKMDPGVDTGPMIAQAAVTIQADDTAETLSARLAQLGADLLVQSLPTYLDGELIPVAQDNQLASYAPMLKKEDGRLDFQQPAGFLARQVRAYNPWPGAYTEWQGQVLKIHRAYPARTENGANGAQSGQTLVYQGLPAFRTAEGLLVLEEVQPAGKKPMPGKVFLNGARGWGE